MSFSANRSDVIIKSHTNLAMDLDAEFETKTVSDPPTIAPMNIEHTTDNSIRNTVMSVNPATSESNLIRRKVTGGAVGFANLPQQYHVKSLKKGFNFNLMVVGESGLGKSTLVSTLFNMPLYPPKTRKDPAAETTKSISIQAVTADLEENHVRLHLTVIDTPGFGDFVNNTDAWRPLVDDIDRRFDAYLEVENKVNRTSIVDDRVHACVYFIQPTGHSLKPLDIVVMKKLHKKVNLVPVIAKSDTLTEEEVEAFKARILDDIKHQGIEIFEPPRYENDDAETVAETQEMMSSVPFAIVGSTEMVVTEDGRSVRGRKYPWGTIEVDNEDHCDFVKLRQLLIRNHLEELRERTANVLYENYRTEKLLELGIQQDQTVFREVNPAMRQEEERLRHEQKLAEMEASMKKLFNSRVKEKEEKLKKSESELFARHREMKEKLEAERRDLEEKKARLLEAGKVNEEKKKKGFSLR